MTCGINLGILLVCLLQAVHVCCSWALQEGEGSQTHNFNTHVGLSHGPGRFDGSRPQDEFRQAYVVKSSSRLPDTKANQGLYNRHYTHTASESRHKAYPSVKYIKSSPANPKLHNVDSSNENVPPKHAFGLSSIASGGSVSKHDSSNQHNGISRTWPGQQGTQHTSQYASSKSDFQNPPKGRNLFPSGSHWPVAWKPHSAAKMHQKISSDMGFKLPGLTGNGGVLNPPKEYVQATSGLARGRKVYPNGSSRKQSSLPYFPIPSNPIVENLREHYQYPISRHFGHSQSQQVSAYNQNPQLVSLQTGMNPAPVPLRGYELHSGRLGPGQRFAPTKIHNIPQQFGGYAIKRLGDEEPIEQTTTQMPVTHKTAKTYTFPPRHTQSYKPQQPSVHHKSKWMRIRSNQLTGAAGVFG